MLKILAIVAAGYLFMRCVRALGFGQAPKARSPTAKAVDKSLAVDAEFEDI